MKTIQVFDPALCCSSGVCGPAVDPALARFAADLAWLGERGVTVERFNLGQQPEQFATQPIVLAEIRQDAEVLPLILADGEIVSRREYPSRRQLAGWAGIEAPDSVLGLSVLVG